MEEKKYIPPKESFTAELQSTEFLASGMNILEYLNWKVREARKRLPYSIGIDTSHDTRTQEEKQTACDDFFRAIQNRSEYYKVHDPSHILAVPANTLLNSYGYGTSAMQSK